MLLTSFFHFLLDFTSIKKFKNDNIVSNLKNDNTVQ